MAMAMTTANVRNSRRAVTNESGKRKENRMGRGNGRGKGRGRATVKGKVWLNNPLVEMISLVPLFCSGRRKCMRQTQTWRAN
jgi:hypothetical protein